MQVRRLQCCGVMELSFLSAHRSAKAAMLATTSIIYSRSAAPYYTYNADKFAYAMFAAAGNSPEVPPCQYGERFKAYILKEGLGTVVETGVNVNPNSNHNLKVFLWTVNHPALRAWAIKNKVLPGVCGQPPSEVSAPLEAASNLANAGALCPPGVQNGQGAGSSQVQAVQSLSGSYLNDILRAEETRDPVPPATRAGSRHPNGIPF